VKKIYKVEFDYPVKIKGKEVKELVFRKPKVKDMRNMMDIGNNEVDREIWLASALSGVTISDIENLDFDQYQLIQKILGKFRRSPTANA